MTPEDLARLHARAFAGQGRAWGRDEFASLLSSPHVFVTGSTDAFALGRAVADEAELLSVVTDPVHRLRGLARAALAAFEAEARNRGAGRAFLEVADDNSAAIALYRAAGYRETARRTGYYARQDGSRIDALIFEKPLG